MGVKDKQAKKTRRLPGFWVDPSLTCWPCDLGHNWQEGRGMMLLKDKVGETRWGVLCVQERLEPPEAKCSRVGVQKS